MIKVLNQEIDINLIAGFHFDDENFVIDLVDGTSIDIKKNVLDYKLIIKNIRKLKGFTIEDEEEF